MEEYTNQEWTIKCNQLRYETAIYKTEVELYREYCQKLKSELFSAKDSLEFSKKENEKVFQLLCSKIFPNYKSAIFEKPYFHTIIRDWEDSMLGVVTDQDFKNSTVTCFMQDGSTRTIDVMKKDWVQFYK